MASGNDERAARLTQGSLVRGVRNSVFLFGGNAISAVISFVITIYIARILPLADFGSYITVISFVTLFGIFTDFGINTVVIREGAKNPEDTHSLIFSTMGLKYLLSLASMLAVIVFALFTPYTFEVKALIVLMSITLLMGGVGSMFSAVFNIYQDMKYISIIQIAERLTFASFAFVFLVVGLGVPGVILAVIIAAFVSLTLNFVISQRIHEYRLNFRPILDSKTRSAILMPAFWFGIAGLLGTVWQRVDTIMLSLLANMTQVGLYTPAVNYVGIGDMAVLALTGAFFPIISRTVHERIITKRELSKYLGYFAVAGLVIVAITYAFGGELMILAFGPKFTESIVFINILVIGFAVNLITIPTALMLDATNNQKVHVVNATYLTGTNIGLNWILIPTLGALGAAYATTISQSLGAILGIPLALYVLKRSGYL